MLDTLQEIQENSLVNNFKEIAEKFGIYGTYVNWQPGGLNEGGVYFVCGLDKDKVCDRNIDMHKILENQAKSKGLVSTDVAALRITGDYPFMLHHDFLEHCYKLDTVKKVYNYLNLPIPSKISNDSINFLRMDWWNFTDSSKPLSARKGYEKMLSYVVKVEAEGKDERDPKYKKNKYILDGYYDTGKGKIYNWFKKHFIRHKNNVTLSHLVSQSMNIGSSRISYRNYDKMKKALNERPDILYSFTKMKGGRLDIGENEGFGSEKANDSRHYTLYYSTVYAKDIEEMIQKINYPTEFNRTIDEIDPYGYGTEHVIIPADSYNIFKEDCEKLGVKFCIDKSLYEAVGGGVAIAFSTADSAKAYKVLNDIVRVAETLTLKDPVISDSSFESKIKSMEADGFKRIDPKNINAQSISPER